MKLLLDTHIALWLASERQKLTFRELRFIDHLDNRAFVSAVSIWELRIKWNTLTSEGNRKGPADPRHIAGALEQIGVTLIPLSVGSAAVSLRDPITHRDPFDEQLLIEAQEHDARLITRDKRLLDHPLVHIIVE